MDIQIEINKFWKNIFIGIMSLALFVVGEKAKASVYYVDNDITDTHVASSTPDFTTYNHSTFSTSGGSDNVFKTIADINTFTTLQPDDQVLFRSGQTWNEQLTIPASGTSGHVVIFSKFGSSSDPVIDAQDTRSYCVNFNAKSFVKITELTLNNGHERGIYGPVISNQASQYVTVDDVTINNSYSGGVMFGGGDHITITNSTLGKVSLVSAADGDGIFIGSSNSSAPATNITISNNIFNDYYGRGALVFDGVRTATISSNTFAPTYLGLFYMVDLEPDSNLTVSGVQVAYNTFDFSNLDAGSPYLGNIRAFMAFGGASGVTVSGMNIYENTFNLGGSGKGIWLVFSNASGTSAVHDNVFNDGGSTDSTHGGPDPIAISGTSSMTCNVYNNTINNSTTGNAISFQSGTIGSIYYNVLNGTNSGVKCSSGATCNVYNNSVINNTRLGIDNAGTMTARNNIISTTSSDSSVRLINEETGAGGTYDHNLYYSPNKSTALFNWRGATYDQFATYKSASSQDSHSLNTNPKFLSASVFYLQRTSPAIDAGVGVGLISDFDEISIPIGRATDIGAYEFQQPLYAVSDFTTMISNWMHGGSGNTSDFNADNIVNTKDMGIIMSGQWPPSPCVSGTCDCSKYIGATAGKKIAACIADTPDGGTADASGITGSQIIGNDIFKEGVGNSKAGTLLLGNATYTLTGSSACMNVPSGWTLQGAGTGVGGTTFNGKGACSGKLASRMIVTTGHDVAFRDFKVDGGGETGNWQCIAAMNGAHDITIDGTLADNCYQYGILVGANIDLVDDGNIFRDITITNNTVTNVGSPDSLIGIGIEVFPNICAGTWETGDPACDQLLVTGLRIANNTVSTSDVFLGCGIKMNSADGGVIEYNNVDISGIFRNGDSNGNYNAGAICQTSSRNSTIQNNTIVGGGNGIGLHASIDQRNPVGLNNMTIQGNNIRGQWSGSGGAIYSENGFSGITISGNTLTKTVTTASYGIELHYSNGFSNVSITNNELNSGYSKPTHTEDPGYVGWTVSGNTCDGTGCEVTYP